jgi:hypothetical protein
MKITFYLDNADQKKEMERIHKLPDWGLSYFNKNQNVAILEKEDNAVAQVNLTQNEIKDFANHYEKTTKNSLKINDLAILSSFVAWYNEAVET